MSVSSATPWTVAHQAPLSVGFLRQDYWSGLPFPSPGDLPDPGTDPASPAWQVDSLPLNLPARLSVTLCHYQKVREPFVFFFLLLSFDLGRREKPITLKFLSEKSF